MKTMKWRCLDCHQNFEGPTDRPPKNGCAHCGSRKCFDCNIKSVTPAIASVLERAMLTGKAKLFLLPERGGSMSWGIEPDGEMIIDNFAGRICGTKSGLVVFDIGMRMFTPRELFRAQGFPESYIIDPIVNGKPMTKTDQIERCGNSVCPPVVEALVRANCADMAAIERAA